MEGPNRSACTAITGGGAISLEPGVPDRDCPARRSRPCTRRISRTDGASGAGARSGAARCTSGFLGLQHGAELITRRRTAYAQAPLQDHDRLHAEGQQPRPRHAVIAPARCRPISILLRSRHGQKTTRVALLALLESRRHIRQYSPAFTDGLSPTTFCRSARKSGATPTRRSALACRCHGHSSRSMGFERWVDYALDDADVFRQARRRVC